MVLYDMYTLDHVMAVIICIFAPIMALTARKISTEEIKLLPEDKIRLYHSNGLLLIVFGLIVTTAWRIPNRPLPGLGLDLPVWHPYVFIFLMIVLVFYFFDIFFQYGNRKWREKTYQERHKVFSFVPADSNEMFHFVFLALAAGIGEEIIFRGYLIHYLIWWTGNTAEGILLACLFSSGLFAFLHGYQGIKSMIKIFFLALVFCGIFIYSQSLIIVIVVHALIDIISGLIGVYLIKELGEEPERPPAP
ncbi:MAG: type II CAAX endopeptidase family protein [Saprospiraceae bacterium]